MLGQRPQATLFEGRKLCVASVIDGKHAGLPHNSVDADVRHHEGINAANRVLLRARTVSRV
jgi:hypothetical protein